MLRRVVTTALLLVAGAVLVYGATQKADPPSPTTLDVAVEALTPSRESTGNLRQGEIGIDLAPGWTGDLRINGLDIPEDQLRRNDPLNQFFFLPGQGQEIEEVPPGRVVVTAFIWRPLQGESRESGSRSVTWTFTVA